jgi:hypothetical protein
MKRHIRNVLSALLSFAMLCGLGQTSFAATFTDVSPSAWYAQAVEYVSENGLMSGTGGGKFSPGTPMTRAMLATVLHRIDGSPVPAKVHGFSDVPSGAYYERAVAWAAENGIVSGIGGGRFGSESHITRQDLTVMLYRYGNFKGYDISASDSLAGFSDSSQVAGYARQAMQWAMGAGIMHGDSGRLIPSGDATRAQVAVMLMQFAQNVAGTEPAPAPERNQLQIAVNGQTFHGELYDNETAKAFTAMLPMTLNMQELNGNEKYHYFDSPLPTNPSRPSGIHTGDLMLYGNNCLVLFYEDFATSYSYTPIGRLDNPAGLERVLGAGDVRVTFSDGTGGT